MAKVHFACPASLFLTRKASFDLKKNAPNPPFLNAFLKKVHFSKNSHNCLIIRLLSYILSGF